MLQRSVKENDETLSSKKDGVVVRREKRERKKIKSRYPALRFDSAALTFSRRVEVVRA